MSRWQTQSIRHQPRRASAWPRRLALVLVLLAVFLLARIVVLHYLPKQQVVVPVVHTSTAEPAVQFDFYTVLPKMAVSAAAPLPTHLPTPTPTVKSLPNSAAGTYVLQIAAV